MKHKSNPEHDLQCACVQWFRYKYPTRRHNLFAVPNGGWRTLATGAYLKAEGTLPGVSDLILVHPHGGPTLFIEMKTPRGRLQKSQEDFQTAMIASGHRYAVCRDLDSFIDLVTDFMRQPGPNPPATTLTPLNPPC